MTPAEPTEAQRQRMLALDKVKAATTRRELAAALVDCARSSIFADATDDIEAALASEKVKNLLAECLRVIERERNCLIENYATDFDDEGEPLRSSCKFELGVDDHDERRLAKYDSLIEQLSSAFRSIPAPNPTKD